MDSHALVTNQRRSTCHSLRFCNGSILCTYGRYHNQNVHTIPSTALLCCCSPTCVRVWNCARLSHVRAVSLLPPQGVHVSSATRSPSCPGPRPPRTVKLSPVPTILSSQICSVNGTARPVTFGDWLFSLSLTAWRPPPRYYVYRWPFLNYYYC